MVLKYWYNVGMMDEINRRYRARQKKDAPEPNIPLKLIWTILAVNALVSLIISLVVALVVGPWLYGSSSPAASNTTVASAAENSTLPPATPALPPPTPTPAEPIQYRVQAGDTLGVIAEKFGVSTDELMAINNLSNPNLIRQGQPLIIPVSGAITIEPTAPSIDSSGDIATTPPRPEQFVVPAQDISLTPTPSPTLPPTATPQPLGQVLVSVSQVLGYGSAENETVRFSNDGAGLSLAGWTLEGSQLGIYHFPNMFLFNGGLIDLHTTTGVDSSSDIYWGQTDAAWQSGDTLILKDNKGVIISSYIIP